MKYEYCTEHDAGIFAQSLQYNQKARKLTWNNTRGMDVVIVQTPYQRYPTDPENDCFIGNICSTMTTQNIKLETGEYVNVLHDVWVMHLDPATILRIQGDGTVRGEACTYTVFCCKKTGDTCVIYSHNSINLMTSPYRDIPLNFEYSLSREMITRRKFLRTVEEYSGYYRLGLPNHLSEHYTDGSIWYKVRVNRNICEIPITRRMLEQENVYIKVSEIQNEPEVFVEKPGFKLIRR